MKYFSTLLGLLFTLCLTAQSNIWTDIDDKQIALPRNSESKFLPTQYRAVSLEIEALQKMLSKSPQEFTQQKGFVLSLPMPDGTMEAFEVWNSSIMEKELADRYPNIKTFKGKSINNPRTITRLGYSSLGFHAMIQSPKGAILIDPLATQQTRYYTSSYAKHSAVNKDIEAMQLSCGTKSLMEGGELTETAQSQSRNTAAPVDLYIYRAAIACTGEYAEYHNASTKEEVVAHFTAIMNRANMIFERDVAIRMVLIADTDQIIFLDSATDPYSEGSNLGVSFSENPTVIETRIAPTDFDIGHVFIAKCSTNGGAVGLASFGSACEISKSSGSSCQFYSDSRFAIELVCHEMGHQLAASHSWANCPGNDQQIAAESAFEPGSGSTIMSYSGACGNKNNIQFVADDYYHSGNIEQMLREKTRENSCANIVATGNITPVVNFAYENGFYIPISTPFELTGTATDENGDELTYCWEQYNLGPAIDLGTPVRTTPTFRSFPPTTSPTRFFPELLDLVNNRNDLSEVLPTYTRNLTFRLTVRDNNVEVGGVDWKNVSFEATDQSGPFLVEFPNKIADFLNAGAFAEIKWDVAGTNQGLVNCQKVNILLSTDRGFTYPYVLVENTDNDGTQSVTIPDLETDRARIKVEAADNIFFDISDRDFSIVSPTKAGFSFATSIQTQQVCLPSTLEIDLTTFSLLNFNQPIIFSGPTSDSDAFSTSFSNVEVIPGTDNKFTITFPADHPSGEFSFDLIGVAQGADTVKRTINLDLVTNLFTGFALTEPVNNSVGIGLPNFQWTNTADANLYEIEIATNPAFGDFIVDEATNIIGTSYTPSSLLPESTIYYWRVRPINDCGIGLSSEIFAFQTETLNCSSESATEVPIIISSQGTPVIESKFTVTENFPISDLNIPKVRGSHNWVSHIRTTLISPAGTTAILFSKKCIGSVPFDLGFDDESPNSIPCPPIGGELYQPQESLSVFDGESSFGEWTLRIEVIDNFGEGGSLDEWSLEFCTNVSLEPPMLVTNEALPVKPKSGRLINNDFLLVEDANNSASDLIYTLVKTPSIGTLLFNKEVIEVGVQFSQNDVNTGAFKYRHDTDVTEGEDEFTFTVTDGEGGWIGITPFQIVIDANATTVGVNDLIDKNLINVFPNPAKEVIYLEFKDLSISKAQLELFDIQGKLIQQQNIDNQLITSIPILNFENGLYFLKVRMEDGVITKKVAVQR